LGAVWFVLNWTEQAAQAAAFEPLTHATVQAGLAFAAGKTTGAVSATVLKLSGKDLVTMSFIAKPIASLATAVCVIGILIGGTNWLLGSNQPPRTTPPSLDTAIRPPRTQAQTIPNAAAPSASLIAVAYPQTTEPAATRIATARTENNSGENEGHSWDLHERSKAAERIESELKNQTEIAFTDTPLTDVMTFLSDYHNIPILLDTAALTEANVVSDMPITRTLDGVSLESALNIVLAPLKLDYVIANEVMLVTTVKQAEATLDVRVYDLSRLPNLEPKTLSAIIMTVTKPEAWTEKGGAGSIVLGTDFVVVNQCQRTHRKIVSLLNQLGRQAKQQANRRTNK
jgi:hypothetical protein